MKKTLLITGVLLALTASIASAAGVTLNWGDCGNEPGATSNKNFACTSNAGNHDMYIGLEPPAQVTQTNGHNHFVDLQTLSPTLPAWWDLFNPGTCRGNVILGSGDFSSSISAGGACVDPWNAAGAGEVVGYNTNFGGVANRVRVVGSVSSADPVGMPEGSEYYSMRIRILSSKTVGTGNCAGCLDPVCLVLNLVRVAQIPGTPGGDIEVSSPANGKRNYITWQGGQIGGAGCPAATPNQNTTWGKVKSLYR